MHKTPCQSFQSRAFQLSLETLRFYRQLQGTSDAPSHLTRQMLRAGTAIGANLEEARSAPSKRDLAAKYTIALREGREFCYWLRLIAADQPDLTRQVDSLLGQGGELVAVLTASVKRLRASEG